MGILQAIMKLVGQTNEYLSLKDQIEISKETKVLKIELLYRRRFFLHSLRNF
jgi:hypothetical protein